MILAGVVVVSGIASRSHRGRPDPELDHLRGHPRGERDRAQRQRRRAQLVTLPGQLQAFYNAPIYSRVSGYVQAWYDDIGAQVKKGQLLAVIDTPETDQQIIQARADLATAQANMNLANTTAQRWARLLKQDAVSAQESEEKAGDFAAKSAQVQAAKANAEPLPGAEGLLAHRGALRRGDHRPPHRHRRPGQRRRRGDAQLGAVRRG